MNVQGLVLSYDITSYNPWWESKDNIFLDKKIEEVNSSKIQWDPRIRGAFNYNKDLVYTLRGPRQVGKTTLIKIQIKKFLENGTNPWNIMYYAFDLYNSPMALVDITKKYFNETAQFRSSDRCFLFFDEISSMRDWSIGIKKLSDDNYLKNCTVVLTGSHSVDLQRSAERLPGRRGEIDENDTYDKIFLPMKFSEYVSILDSDLKRIIDRDFQRESRTEIFYSLLDRKIDSRFQKPFAILPKLNRYLQNYLLTGGIPKVIDEYLKNGKIGSSVYYTYFQSIIGDIHSLDADESTFKRLINHLIEKINFTFSFRDIQKNIDVGSTNTVERYINLLCNMFILTKFYRYDSEKKQKRMDKPKKIHFHDPFFLHTLNSWTKPEESFKTSQKYLSNAVNQGSLLEGIVGDHLIRLVFHLVKKKEMYDYSNYIFYWQDENNYEVDYVFYNGNDIEVPVEVKYTDNETKKNDINGIINFKRVTGVKNAILVTKRTLRMHDEYVEIPASIFLLFI